MKKSAITNPGNLSVQPGKDATKKIKESEEKFQAAIAALHGIVWTNNAKGEMEGEQPAWASLTGQTYEEYQGSGWCDAVHPDDAQPTANAWQNAINNQKTFVFEHRLKVKDGSWRLFSIRAVPLKNEDGGIREWVGVHIDITEQRQTENAAKENEALLQEQKRLYETVTNNTPDLIYVFDLNYCFTYANEALLAMWGKTWEESIGKNLLQNGYEPWHAEMHEREIDQVIATKKPIRGEVSFPHAVLGRRIYDYIFAPVINESGEVEAVSGTTRDISDIKNAENKLKESESRFRNMIEQAPVAMLLSRGEDMVIESLNNPMLPFIHKKSAEEVLGKKLVEALPELAGQPVLETVLTVLRSGIPFRGDEQPVDLVYNGRLQRRYFNLSYDQIKDADDNAAVLHMAIDVTEQVVARRKIEESEKQFRLLADTVPQLVWTADVQGNVYYYNQSVFDYTGLSLEEIRKDGWMQIVHPDDREENIKQWMESIQTGKDYIFEHRLKRYDGVYRWQLSRAVPQKDEDGNITMWVGSSTDIQKIKEEEKRKGDFVKLVSHELKTPVTSIKGYVQLLLSMQQQDDNTSIPGSILRTSLERVDKQIVRLTRLITEMLDLSRVDENRLELKKDPFSIQHLVEETVQDIRHTNSSHTVTVVSHADGIIKGDRDRIQQVLINLINNAVKYSPLHREVNVSLDPAGPDSIAVSVKDYGIGINKTDQEKIFERFYRVTGKNEETFSGFGIGLFIANQIIERHNGKITVESEPGKGSVFTFILPATKIQVHYYAKKD